MSFSEAKRSENNHSNLEHKNKYKTEICNNKMTFQDCELAIIRHAADENEKKQGEKIINSEDIRDIIKILEEFIIRKRVICYGGIAINNILPKNVQFYNYNSDIPDYDFFSPNAINDAKELVDIYYSKGYTEVEAKSGMHIGTFKVFVNFFQIADITYLDPELFKILEKDAIEIAGIYYTPPDFLRMSVYLEFSRPSGDVSRWEKIYKRLELLNKYYPFASKMKCNHLSEHNIKHDENLFYLVRDSLIQQGVVFFGSYATSLYAHYDKKTRANWKTLSSHSSTPEFKRNVTPNSSTFLQIPDFDVLSEDPSITALIVKNLLIKHGYKNVKEIEHEAIGEIIPRNIEIIVENNSVVKIYWTIACHNYNTITIGKQEINVATIDTILSFYLAFLYTKSNVVYKEKLLCMAKFLFDIQEKNHLEQKGLLRRFNMKCIGKQPTMQEIRAEKSKVYEELKNKKNSADYEMWFLRYLPKQKKNGKQLGVYNEKPGVQDEEEEEPEEKYQTLSSHSSTPEFKRNVTPNGSTFLQKDKTIKTIKTKKNRNKQKVPKVLSMFGITKTIKKRKTWKTKKSWKTKIQKNKRIKNDYLY